MDRTAVITKMYRDYLAAHDRLVAGTSPADIPELAAFSELMDDATVFRFPSLHVELVGRHAIEQFMVDARQTLNLRETSEQIIEHGNLVISFNRTSMNGAEGDDLTPVVAVFQFDGDRLAEFWGFAG